MDSQKPYIHPPFPLSSDPDEETPPHGHQLAQINAPPALPSAAAPYRAHNTGGYSDVTPLPSSMAPAAAMHDAYAPTPPHGTLPISAHTPWPPGPAAHTPTGSFQTNHLPNQTGSFQTNHLANQTGSFQATHLASQTGSFGAAPSSGTGSFQIPSSTSGSFPSSASGSFPANSTGGFPAAMTGSFPAQTSQPSAPARPPESKRVSYGIWGGLAGGLVGVSLGVFNAILEGTEIAQALDPLIIITMASMILCGGICAAYPAALERQLKRAGVSFGEDS